MKDDFKILSKIYDQVIHVRDDITWKSLFNLTEYDQVLEVGGGTGRILSMFSQDTGHLYLCDFSFPMLRKAKQKKLFSEICSCAEHIPIAKESFKYILMVDTLHHLFSPSKAVNEMIRILKPGGILVIEEPNINNWKIKIIAVFEKLLGMRSHFYTNGEIVKMIESKNVDVTSVFEQNNFYLQIRKK